MNKKNLSVVMAGAMLATSVAPVLAADTTTSSNTYEVTKGNAGLLIDKLNTYFKDAPKFDKTVETEPKLKGESVYAYQVREAGKSDWTTLAVAEDVAGEGTTDTNELRTLLANAPADAEYELRVIDRGHRTDANGKIVSKEADSKSYENYTEEDLQKVADIIGATSDGVPDTSLAIDTSSLEGKGLEKLGTLFDAGNSKTNAVIKKVTGLNGSDLLASANKVGGLKLTLADDSVIELKPGMECLNFDSPISSDKDVTDAASAIQSGKNTTVTGFNVLINETKGNDIDETTLYTVNIVKGDKSTDYKVTDLYDGFMLTDEGHTLLNTLKTIVNKKEDASASDEAKYDVTISDKDLIKLNKKFTVTITDNNKTEVVTISGSSDDIAKLETLHDWLTARKANVDILAGDNRYATAVEIAKEYAVINSNTVSANGEIVLVNGEALVDGLAAAPYAKAKNAPILLTATDKLSKETKAYLKELVDAVEVEDLDTIKVTIIGGEAVVSQNVVNELKDLGFDVERIAGDNREETSLAVAEEMGATAKTKGAFVIGAEGEADAMSIAPYAAVNGSPIIVSKSATKGLSTNALNDLSDYSSVTIIGGEKAVPASTEESLENVGIKEANIERIAGAKRQDTNAEIIKKYHKNYANVLVAKDGMNNKSELVDALPVSIFAAANTTTVKADGTVTAAPIVLATDKVTDAQVNEIVLNRASDEDMNTVYQVGYGVDRTVMNTIVTKLGLDK